MFRLARSQQQGFTLIEIMAVLVVIGIAAGAVTIAVGDSSRPQQMKASARTLYNSISLGAEEAIYSNRVLGLRFDFDYSEDEARFRYDWMMYSFANKTWQKYELLEKEDDAIFPEDVLLEIELEGEKLVIGKKKDEDEQILEVVKQKGQKRKDIVHPDLYFLPSGEMQDFTIRIAPEEDEEKRYLIKGNLVGQLEFFRPHEEDEEE